MLRLSDAIRLGAMLRPQQAFYRLFDAGTQGTCANGAAAEAVGLLDVSDPFRPRMIGIAPKDWWWSARDEGACPACPDFVDTTTQIVIHLNNEHRWTRERIANFVESRERAQASDVRADAGSTPISAARSPSRDPLAVGDRG
jgi:hypothetical protein